MPKRYYTKTEFANLLGLSVQSLYFHIKNGSLETTKVNGRLVIDAFDQVIGFAELKKDMMNDPSPKLKKVMKFAHEYKKKLQETNSTGDDTYGVGGDDDVFDRLSLAKAKEIQERYKAKTAKMEYELTIGALVKADEIKTTWENTAVLIRKTIANIPDRIAPLVAAENDQVVCWTIIEKECRMILEDLANELEGK